MSHRPAAPDPLRLDGRTRLVRVRNQRLRALRRQLPRGDLEVIRQLATAEALVFASEARLMVTVPSAEELRTHTGLLQQVAMLRRQLGLVAPEPPPATTPDIKAWLRTVSDEDLALLGDIVARRDGLKPPLLRLPLLPRDPDKGTA